MEEKDKIYLKTITDQQDKFLERLDKINKRNNTTNRIIAICVTIIVLVWIIGFYITHYFL